MVELTIEDTGPGIPAEMREKVFEPFFTTKDVGRGSGLGLSQVLGFAVQSGGFAELRSALGEGTTVSLYFPVQEGDA
jgi:signal transduction histidine kinase